MDLGGIAMLKKKEEENSLSKMIAKDIIAQIITGELNPGDKLVEKEYADMYGTSRAPVREAVYMLTTEGLVERIPRKGAIVKEYSNDDIIDLLEIRNMLELMAVKRIAIHGPDQELLKEMNNIIQKMSLDTAIYTYTKLNYSFHTCIVKMSRSNPIQEMYSRLGLPLLRIQNLSFSQEGNIKKSIEEHKEIYRFIKEQKMDELESLLTQHNEYVITSIRKILDM